MLNPTMDALRPVGISPNLPAACLLLIFGGVAMCVRLVALPGRTPAMWMLLGGTMGNIAASLVVNQFATNSPHGITGGSALIVSGFTLAIVAWQPSMVTLTEPAMGQPPPFGTLRVVGLGASIFIAPLTMVIVRKSDGV